MSKAAGLPLRTCTRAGAVGVACRCDARGERPGWVRQPPGRRRVHRSRIWANTPHHVQGPDDCVKMRSLACLDGTAALLLSNLRLASACFLRPLVHWPLPRARGFRGAHKQQIQRSTQSTLPGRATPHEWLGSERLSPHGWEAPWSAAGDASLQPCWAAAWCWGGGRRGGQDVGRRDGGGRAGRAARAGGGGGAGRIRGSSCQACCAGARRWLPRTCLRFHCPRARGPATGGASAHTAWT